MTFPQTQASRSFDLRNGPQGEAIAFQNYTIAAVIPCYRVERDIQPVLQAVPPYIKHIIVVDDASPDSTADLVTASAKEDDRILLIRHPSNQGVGGAMVTGYQKALELEAQVVVKIDGDGQMDMDHLPKLLEPLIEGKADYTKGNRFRDFRSLQRMPFIRRVGNMGLAGHRDTFFRRLRDIRASDDIRVVTTGGTFTFKVNTLTVVSPKDTWVLNPTRTPTLTLVTCYPFTYIGSAPQRFIVHAVASASVPISPGAQPPLLTPDGRAPARASTPRGRARAASARRPHL